MTGAKNAGRYPLTLAVALLVAACGLMPRQTRQPPASGDGAASRSGLDTSSFDLTVPIRQDFEGHFNGRWRANVRLPPDHPSYGAIPALQDQVLEQIKAIIAGAAEAGSGAPGSEPQQIGDLYASYLDEARAYKLGVDPLKDSLTRISKLHRKSEIPALVAYLDAIGVAVPVSLRVAADPADPTKMLALLRIGGLGLPARGYYNTPTPDMQALTFAYVSHVERILSLGGDKNAAHGAADVLRIESRLAGAGHQVPGEPVRLGMPELTRLVTAFDWAEFLRDAGVSGRADAVLVNDADALSGLASALDSEPVSAWQAYFKWQLLHAYAPYLSIGLRRENFGFYGAVLQGLTQPEPSWRSGTELVSDLLGDAVGKLYVATRLTAATQARAEVVVRNVIEAYKQSLDSSNWLQSDSRRRAIDKLGKLRLKLGAPQFWHDYTGLAISRDDLVGNILRARRFHYRQNAGKVGQFADSDEWPAAPQSFEITYGRSFNDLVVPAAMLQAPVFDSSVDDAVNYGALGALVARELSHAFDPAGSRYDGDGRSATGWSEAEIKAFQERTRPLVEQYAQYEWVPGFHVDGERTLPENIADLSGLAIAYKAYRLSQKQEPPVLDGLTGNQRFYAAWIQLMRIKTRREEAILVVSSDKYAPSPMRMVGPVVHQDAFFEAFDIRSGDPSYAPPAQRVELW